MRLALLPIVAVLAVAGCGNDDVSPSEAADLLAQHVPGAKDVQCQPLDDSQFTCDATVNGSRTTFSVFANNQGVSFGQHH